jgi:hypothetical protein
VNKKRESLFGENNRRADFGEENSYLLHENEVEVAHGAIPDPNIDPEGEEAVIDEIQQWLAGGPLPEDCTELPEENEENLDTAAETSD